MAFAIIISENVDGDDMGAAICHLSSELAVAAGNVKDSLASPESQKPQLRRFNEQLVKVVALAHPLIPEGGVLIPNLCNFMRHWDIWTFFAIERGLSRLRQARFVKVQRKVRLPLMMRLVPGD